MVYTRLKRIKGNIYFYSQRSYRQNGKVKTKHVKYIGTSGSGSGYFSSAGNSSNVVPNRDEIIQQVTNNARKIYQVLGDKKYELKAYQKLFSRGQDTKNTFFDKELKQYKAERKKLHDEILNELDNARAVPNLGEKPTIILLGGAPGSGKSQAILKKLDTEKFVVLDSDNIKSKLPEYNGLNASLLHEESSDLFDAATHKALEQGKNIILDATLKNTEKAKKKIELYKQLGYTVKLYATNVPTNVSLTRATDRFLKSGRYVPLNYISENVDRINQSVSDVAPFTDEYKIYNTDVPIGEEPKLISQGSGSSSF